MDKSVGDSELAHFFAWARQRAYAEFERRIKADPSLDPNWTFSDIMQELLEDYRKSPAAKNTAARRIDDEGNEIR